VIGGRRLPAEAVFPGDDDRFRVTYVRADSHAADSHSADSHSASADVRVRVVECTPEAWRDTPSSPPDVAVSTETTVLCVHGWGCSAYSYRHILPALARAGCHAIALDLPGHGESDKPDRASAYALDALTDAVASVCASLSIARCIVVGHSMGGPIVMELVRRYSHLASAAVLLAPVGFGRPGHLAIARWCTPRWLRGPLPYITPRWVAWFALHSAYGVGSRPTRRDLDEYWAPSRSPSFVRALQRLLHDYPWRVGEDGRWGGMEIPTQVLRGDRDPLVAARGVEGYRQALRHCVITTIAGCGHAVPDEVPDRVVEAILQMRRY